ncbi:MAG TPA: hypothetical protein VM100_10965 [Longimicrobiales bacterium]|nr:hypothetical protein [Longimicrobiales bacterium]
MRKVLFTLLLGASPLVAQDTTKVVKPGFGTLKQDAFTMGIRSGALLIKVTPLNERVIALAAPDTYNRLHALGDSKRYEAVNRVNTKEPELFLVSFFSYQPDVTFQPEDLQVEYNGKLLRAAAILPITSTWGKNRMDQQEMQAAIYVFPDAMDFEQQLTVKYGLESNGNWQKIIPVLQVERTKILSRTVKKD